MDQATIAAQITSINRATRSDEVLVSKSYTAENLLSLRFGEHFGGFRFSAYIPGWVDSIQVACLFRGGFTLLQSQVRNCGKRWLALRDLALFHTSAMRPAGLTAFCPSRASVLSIR